LFAAKCINYRGTVEIVHTYAHDMRSVVHDIPRFIKQHIPGNICADLTINGMKFFRADARPLFEKMLALANQGVMVYPRSVYKR